MVSMTTLILRGWAVVDGGVVLTVSARVRSSPWKDAPKMMAPVWCSTWSPSKRRTTRMQAQRTLGVRCWVPDVSVKKMMLVSLGDGRRAIAVG